MYFGVLGVFCVFGDFLVFSAYFGVFGCFLGSWWFGL